MKEFLTQIQEDIRNIQSSYEKYDERLKQDWFAYNYWILMYLYHIDIDRAFEYITEYNNKGCDCYVYYEDTKELYLIQNTYYKETTPLDRHIVSDFLTTPISMLQQGCYSRLKELQDIFNANKNDEDFHIYLYFYTTKSLKTISSDINILFENFNNEQHSLSIEAKIFDVNEIMSIYNGERYEENINFEYSIHTIGKRKTIIDLKPENHDRENNVPTLYAAVNVYDLYKMFVASEIRGYNLFDKNIREYLGIKNKKGQVNKGIKDTLSDEQERSRFFYYNNGITIICDDYQVNDKKSNCEIKLVQPQIVNGCQTVNTIAQVLAEYVEKYDEKSASIDFKHCSILVKIFTVKKQDEKERDIYEKIVKYTNTQTGITAKDFTSKDTYFLNLQEDFLKRGFYLIVKQSDEYKYSDNETLFEQSKNLSCNVTDMFGITVAKAKDLFIPLDTLLKVLLAFYFDGCTAFKFGSSALKENSEKYYINFSKKIREIFTTDSMINLYFTYVKAGGLKRGKKERTPVPYYMLDFIGRNIKENPYNFDITNKKLNWLFSDVSIFNEIYEKICQIIEDYVEEYMKLKSVDYSTMTKSSINEDLINSLFRSKLKEAQRNNWNIFIKYLDK